MNDRLEDPAAGRPPIVLASASPRRVALLGLLGLTFGVAPARLDETQRDGEAPVAYAVRLAEAKALAGAAQLARGLVLGADTIVELDGEVLGKPANEAQAATYLRRLRGRGHNVTTAVAVVDAATGQCASGRATTAVWMRAYGDDEIAAYVATGDPLDKAGAYAVQHAGFHPVAHLDGSRSNVIGLPLELVRELLGRFGVRLSPDARTSPDGHSDSTGDRG